MANRETQSPSIPEPTTDPAALLKTVQALKQAVEILTGQRKPGLSSLSDQFTDLRARVGNSNARFSEYIEVQANNYEALTRRTTTLEAETADNKAEITRVDTAHTDAESALAQSITTLDAKYEGVTGDIAASVQEEQTARADADGALAQDITNVNAKADDGTASGQIKLQAVAGLNGVSATYSWVISANNESVGMYAIVRSDGHSSIAWNADLFTFYDGSGVRPILTYASGYFTFNGNVTINGGLLVNGTVNTVSIASNAVSQVLADTHDNVATVNMNCRGGTYVLIATYYGNPQRFPVGSTFVIGTLQLRIDGNVGAEVGITYDTSGSSNVSVSVMATPISGNYNVGAGAHAFQAVYTGSINAPVSLVVMELMR